MQLNGCEMGIRNEEESDNHVYYDLEWEEFWSSIRKHLSWNLNFIELYISDFYYRSLNQLEKSIYEKNDKLKAHLIVWVKAHRVILIWIDHW